MNISVEHWRSFFGDACHHFAELDSTQSYLQSLPRHVHPAFCRADQQRAGHGQRGRPWQSPFGNLYCSIRMMMAMPPSVQAGLAQQVALSIVTTLDPTARVLKLKWPNDLFTTEGKCGGILIDMSECDEQSLVTIGIGLNLAQAEADQGMLARDLDSRFDTPESVLDVFMPTLIADLQRWSEKPYLAIDHRWSEYDRFHEHSVTLEGHPNPVKLYGIDQKGALIARDKEGLHFLTNVRIQVPE